MPFEFKVTHRVEFSETDMAGIVHYSNFFRYMEKAEHAFFRSLGFSIVMDQSDPPVGWPRVRAECDYKQPLRFEDEIEIHLLVTAKKSKSISYLFRIKKLGGQVLVEVASGRLTVVCVCRDETGKMSAHAIPGALSGMIEIAPSELLA